MRRHHRPTSMPQPHRASPWSASKTVRPLARRILQSQCHDTVSRIVRVPPIWVWPSIAAAAVAATVNIEGLLATHRICGRETIISANVSIARISSAWLSSSR